MKQVKIPMEKSLLFSFFFLGQKLIKKAKREAVMIFDTRHTGGGSVEVHSGTRLQNGFVLLGEGRGKGRQASSCM